MAEFRLLGLVEVRSNDQPVPVGQPRQRLVLAALLADAGRPVTPDALIYRVWGDLVPDGARHSLHEYLTRVRRLLAQVADDRGTAVLSRRGGVYVLDVDKDQVDLHLFRRLVERSRDTDCSDEERLAVLDRALRLWRGEPLADLSGPWVEQVRESSRRLRIEATQLLAQASLRLGRSNEIVEPLRELAAENPLSEPVAAELMRALHATGRTVEALDCYTAIGKRLVEDLGTDPGPELRAVHQMILRGDRESDPAPDSPSPVPPRPAAAVPAQLPGAVRGFAGRVEQLAQLDALLADESPAVVVSAVSGTAGVGKTALAVHWAHRVADQFPDGQLYVNLGGFDESGPMTPSDALAGFLDALGVPPPRIPADLAGQAALYRSVLAGRRVLVVLDNARDADQVRPLLPGTPRCLAVVTSRSQLTGLVAVDGALPLTLDILSTMEARELLVRRLGAERVAADPEAVLAVIDACARLPLALAIASARAQQVGFPLSHLAAELATARGRLDALDAGDPASQVRVVLSWSYAALGPADARLFRLLGLQPGQTISAAAVASLAGRPLPETRQQLTNLTRANLLAEYSPGRYTFHDLLRAYAADLTERVDPAGDRHAAITRLLNHYLHTTYAAAFVLNPARNPIDVPLSAPAPGVSPEQPADRERAMAWLEAEHAVLLAAIRWSAHEGFDTYVWQLADSLDTFHFLRGRWTDQITVWRTALLAGRRLNDLTVQARAQHAIGVAANLLERDDEAHEALRAALDLAIAAGDRSAEAGVHRSLSVLMERLDRPELALDHDRQALALSRAAGDLRGEASGLNAVGWDLVVLGDYAGATEICEQAIAVYQQVGDRHGEASAWDSLGYAEDHTGNHVRAITCYRHAVDMFSDIGDHYNHAGSLTRLGDTHQALGDHESARTAWRQALDLLTDLSHPDAATVRAKLDDKNSPKEL